MFWENGGESRKGQSGGWIGGNDSLLLQPAVEFPPAGDQTSLRGGFAWGFGKVGKKRLRCYLCKAHFLLGKPAGKEVKVGAVTSPSIVA